MLGKSSNQISLADTIINTQKINNKFLEDINKLIDFRPILKELKKLYPSKTGRPSHPPLLMFKILLLQHFYNLSDPQTEEQVNDRLSFRKFLGLSLDESIPDETTICRFRDRLIKSNLQQKLLSIVNNQFEQKNLIVKHATLIDATIVESPTKRPTKEEQKNEEQTDKDASYAVKQGKTYYGYKMHASVDRKNHLIRKASLTTASIHDSHKFEDMLMGDEKKVYADKAYCRADRFEFLSKNNIYNGILEKGYRGHLLTRLQIKKNRKKSIIRSSIEKVFAHLKRWLGYYKVRYIGIIKNELELQLKCVAYNIKRAVKIAYS